MKLPLRALTAVVLLGAALMPPATARAAGELAGNYACYIYMGNQISYTYMGFTLGPDGHYEWGEEVNGQFRGDGGTYSVEGARIAFTGAMADTVGTIKPKATGRPSIDLVPNGETWKTMYCSPQ